MGLGWNSPSRFRVRNRAQFQRPCEPKGLGRELQRQRLLMTRPSAEATTFVVNRQACLGAVMKVVRVVVALAVALVTFSIAGRTASAAPPSNDTIAGAT